MMAPKLRTQLDTAVATVARRQMAIVSWLDNVFFAIPPRPNGLTVIGLCIPTMDLGTFKNPFVYAVLLILAIYECSPL